MLYSKLFGKPTKIQKKFDSANATFLINGGFIYQEMAGVYAILPMGLRVLEKIKNIVRNRMNEIGGQELIMTSLQRKELWEKTDRWDDEKVDVWFKSQLKNGVEVGLAWSHEEQITEMMKNYVASYRDLPVYVYQFQNKLRNELRAKSGILRGREFLMKDLYSYSTSEEAHEKFYQKATKAYLQIFEDMGLGDDTFLTFASGGAFTQFSHEFQTLSDVGEDTIYLDRKKKIAINKEVLTDEVIKIVGVKKEDLEELKAAEVGNIFSFGSTKCEEIGLYFTDSNGKKRPVILGSYGIGVTRLMGMIVEKFHDKNGIIWPAQVAPFDIHLIGLNLEDENIMKKAFDLYEKLEQEGFEVLFDDRNGVSPGVKFSESDMIGNPIRLVISKRTGDKVEFKRRNDEKTQNLTVDELMDKLKKDRKILS